MASPCMCSCLEIGLQDDGFGAIDANTPCPFKISVTNSVAERADERAAQQTEALVTAVQRAKSKSFRANPVAERVEERASQQPETMVAAARTTAKSFRGNTVAERAEERAVQQTEALLNAAQRSASKSFRGTMPRSVSSWCQAPSVCQSPSLLCKISG